MDIIVFCQEELDKALLRGCRHICLCDGQFSLAAYGGIRYTAIGSVSASFPAPREEADKLGIVFEGFTPGFAAVKTPVYALMPCPVRPPSSYSSSFSGSFASSFAASLSGSFGALFITSFSGSFSMRLLTSFSGSFAASLRTSFRTSFRLKAGSFTGSFKTGYLIKRERIVKEISVNGYGLNLI